MILIYFLSVIAVMDIVSGVQQNQSIYNLKRRLNQDKKLRSIPLKPHAQSLPVGIHLEVYDFSGIDQIKMEYTMTFLLTQVWEDRRLSYDEENDTNSSLLLITEWMNNIWKPHTLVRNSREEKKSLETLQTNYVGVLPNGTVGWAQRITARLQCRMNLEYFPFDVQRCPLVLENFVFPRDMILYYWMDAHIQASAEFQDFYTEDLYTVFCDECGNSCQCIEAQFAIRRKLLYYVVTLYLPSVLLGFIGWLSFWIDLDSAPARTSVGTVLVFTCVLYGTSMRERLPRVSYIKSTDVWDIVMLFFVMIVLIEYVVASYIHRKRKDSDAYDNSYIAHFRRDPGWGLDVIFRWLYGTSFIVFVVSYFWYYDSVSV